MTQRVAYLVNQYPKVSHSFIRREILAVEALGVSVLRCSIRSCDTELVDAADRAELAKTRVVLKQGLGGLLQGVLTVALRRPLALLGALGLAVQVGRRSERGVIIHGVYLAEACVLYQWFCREQVSHVHVHFGTNSATVALLCRQLGGPSYSFTVHGPEEFDHPVALSLGEKVAKSAFVVAVSSFGRSQIYRWCHPSQWSKVVVVHCGVDDEFLQHPYSSVPDTPQLVCVGRLSEQKGHLLLLEAATRLALEGVEFRLVFVGDGPLRGQVEATIDRYGLQDRIQITGWASGAEVKRYLLDSRALVLPSFAEGLPVVIMEALALARPVISTYIAGIPELVEPGGCGWLVPAGSLEGLLAAMRSALLAPADELSAMGKAGRLRVEKDHCVAVEAGKLAVLFRAACGDSSEGDGQGG